MSVIYLATNIINGKPYIGFDSSWPNRKARHLRKAFNPNAPSYNFVFHRAIRKYGPEAFSWSVLYHSENAQHTLGVMESRFIQEYKSHYLYGRGYNMTLGGEGSLGRLYRDQSQETKNKRSISMKNSPAAIKHRNLVNSTPVTCPHCGAVGKSAGAMHKWHFQKCRTLTTGVTIV